MSKEELEQMVSYITKKYAEVLRELAKYEKEERLSGKAPVGESTVQTKDNTQQEKGE